MSGYLPNRTAHCHQPTSSICATSTQNRTNIPNVRVSHHISIRLSCQVSASRLQLWSHVVDGSVRRKLPRIAASVNSAAPGSSTRTCGENQTFSFPLARARTSVSTSAKKQSFVEIERFLARPHMCHQTILTVLLSNHLLFAPVKNGDDELSISRVVNGMWQTSGSSWGRIDGPAAVEAMMQHADAGLTTFDMADICQYNHTCNHDNDW